MIDRIIVAETIASEKVIAIIRGVYGQDCLRLCSALDEGGIHLIEVTYDQLRPELHAQTDAAIAAINSGLGGRVLAGAGTVTSPALVERAVAAGAQYIISPDMNPAVIARTRELGAVSIPGALTPTEIQAAHLAGADFVKVFPANIMGPAYIKSVRAPLSHIKLLAVGGMNASTVGDYIRAGACGVGVGGALTAAANLSDPEKLAAIARSIRRAVEI